MADEFVRKEHFDEYVQRVDERFAGIEIRMEQGFAHAAKEREQNFLHLNQRIDDLNRSINQRFDDLRGMLIIMYTPLALAIVGAVVGAAVKYLFN